MTQSQIDRLKELCDEKATKIRLFTIDAPDTEALSTKFGNWFQPKVKEYLIELCKSDELRDIVKDEWNETLREEIQCLLNDTVKDRDECDKNVARYYWKDGEIQAYKNVLRMLKKITLPQPPMTKEEK